MASVLNDLAGATKGRAIIGLVSAKDLGLVRTFGIRKIPAIFVVRNAAITASFIGLVPRKTIEQALQ
jgi:thioredoxin-like negative regulator of GroEL